MTLIERAGHADVADVGGAPRQDPLVGRGDVRVRAADGADAPVEVDAEGVLLARQLAVEVDQAHRRQLVGAVVEQRGRAW